MNGSADHRSARCSSRTAPSHRRTWCRSGRPDRAAPTTGASALRLGWCISCRSLAGQKMALGPSQVFGVPFSRILCLHCIPPLVIANLTSFYMCLLSQIARCYKEYWRERSIGNSFFVMFAILVLQHAHHDKIFIVMVVIIAIALQPLVFEAQFLIEAQGT
jgi:hypothetical protein